MESIMVPSESYYNINLLDKINLLVREIEKDFETKNILEKSNKSFEKFENFKKWLDENGAIYKENLSYPVQYGKFNIIGSEAKREILPNQGILYVPKKLIIDSNELKKTQDFQIIFEKIPNVQNLNILILTIFLLQEFSKEISFFKPYIEMINSDAPIFWGENLLSQIDEENFFTEIIEFKNDLINYYSSLIDNKIINSEKINLNIFITFYSFVLSRNFCVSDEQMLMVPLADSLNHHHVSVKYECYDLVNFVCKYTQEFDDTAPLIKTDNGILLQNVTHNLDKECDLNLFDSESDEILNLKNKDYFLISTNEDQNFKIGHQVFNFYGHYSNEYLLKWYGFCYFHNIHDYISIILNIPKYEDHQFDKLLEVFFSNHLQETIKNNFSFNFNTLFFKLKVKKVNLKFLNYIRFFYFYEIEDINLFVEYSFNYDIELEILTRTIDLLRISLEKKNFSHSLEQDYLLLKEIFHNRNNELNCDNEMRFFYILIFRITQKLNLIKQIEYFENIKEILEAYAVNCLKENFNEKNILNSLDKLKIYIEKIEVKKEVKNYFNSIFKFKIK
jgi:hypothetical protein